MTAWYLVQNLVNWYMFSKLRVRFIVITQIKLHYLVDIALFDLRMTNRPLEIVLNQTVLIILNWTGKKISFIIGREDAFLLYYSLCQYKCISSNLFSDSSSLMLIVWRCSVLLFIVFLACDTNSGKF
jgi:hypothetical protein